MIERRARDRQSSSEWRDRFDRRLGKLETDFYKFQVEANDHHREVLQEINRNNTNVDSALKVFGVHIQKCDTRQWLTVAGWAAAMTILLIIGLRVFTL